MLPGTLPNASFYWHLPHAKASQVQEPSPHVPRRHKVVATDTVYSETLTVDSCVTQAQLFVGKESMVSGIYPMRSGKQFVNTLEDNIHRNGAMDKIISDLAKNEISHKVINLLNRILSKVQKSFWSCTHVNSCQNYIPYINLHILLNILCKTTSDIQESRKSIMFLKR